jgi:hypothetical protein
VVVSNASGSKEHREDAVSVNDRREHCRARRRERSGNCAQKCAQCRGGPPRFALLRDFGSVACKMMKQEHAQWNKVHFIALYTAGIVRKFQMHVRRSS